MLAARQECARVGAQLDAARAAAAEKISLLEGTEARLREAFAALSADALKRNNESFLQLARTSLGEFQRAATTDLDGRHKALEAIVQPLRESLTRVDSKLQDVEKGRVSTQAQLAEQLRSLTQAQQVLQSETGSLSRALRSPNIRGQWGELQLRRVLENAGLIEGSHYELKEAIQTEDGRLTPDVIVKLPGGKNVVVDAKVALTAYLDAAETDDESRRELKLRDHARQVKDHVVRLANKSYWAHFQPAPDIVVMFVPGEALLSAALQHDPALLEFSMAEGVMLASPLTLIALLRAIVVRLAAGNDRAEREGDQRAGPSALRPHRQARGALRRRRPEPGEGGPGLQRRGRHAGNPRAGDGAAPEGQGRHRAAEFAEPETIDHTPRPLGAPQLIGLFDDDRSRRCPRP